MDRKATAARLSGGPFHFAIATANCGTASGQAHLPNRYIAQIPKTEMIWTGTFTQLLGLVWERANGAQTKSNNVLKGGPNGLLPKYVERERRKLSQCHTIFVRQAGDIPRAEPRHRSESGSVYCAKA